MFHLELIMTMLAEPRRKQKLSLNPRGTNWSNDNSKFGQRMLEKMGWTKGRGLGAKEHGQTEHVKVTLKSDKRGIGCSRNFADKWIEHQDDFNMLLASLNQDHCQGNEADGDKMDSSITQVSSLEAKSKLSRSRVHYQKFTKGKDLSSKSLHDLACVFGQRKSKSEPDTPQNKSEANSDAEDNEKNYQGVLTVKSEDSVQEYFAKKMAKLQKNKNGIEPSDDQDCNRGSPESETVEDKADQLSDKLKKKSKSKKKSVVTFSIGNEEINTSEETRIKENAVTVSLSNEETNLSTKSRSKKSKKRKYLETIEKLERNVKDASLSIECDSVSEPKKSKKKDEFDQECSGKDEIVNKSDNSLNTGHETSLKFEDDNFNNDPTSYVSTHFAAKSRHKKSKKRKHSKKSAGSLQEEKHIDEDPLPSTEAGPVLEPKKSNKKKKSENIEMRTKEEVDTLEGNKEEKEIIKSRSSKKSKKKKEETHVENKKVENVTVNVTDDIENKKEECGKKCLIENPNEEKCKDERNERAVNDNKQKDEAE
ncbi:hypothetical protein CHS0354_040852 [Potamilus streckersoni]|uniref:G-patch domain-containing protein n=1 Tax=Potamilus streckersoni TaxID=2493646 RepID=A0AAE0SLF3_9BIVA|nr:hypothetical protein CHS0354_040852 [Potamilus streckersoni]